MGYEIHHDSGSKTMSASIPPTETPTVSTSNVAGSLASTILGIAVAAPQIVESVQHVTLPTTLAGWLQIAMGALALFLK